MSQTDIADINCRSGFSVLAIRYMEEIVRFLCETQAEIWVRQEKQEPFGTATQQSTVD
jgi:hypothetical protein